MTRAGKNSERYFILKLFRDVGHIKLSSSTRILSVSSPGVGLLGLRPSQSQRQEQGDAPDAAHVHHDAACTNRNRLLQRRGDGSRRREVKDRGEEEEEAALSGWAERVNEWGGIGGG